MGKVLNAALGTVAIVNALTGCNTSGCTDNQNSLPMAGFYSFATGGSITVDSLDITGVGAPGDSLLYATGERLSLVYLPFRATADITSYCFHYTQSALNNPEFNDTLTFRYQSRPFFASEECGAMLQYDIKALTYTRHLIDSVAIVDSLVTNTDQERIKIYFRTSEE